ncbi:chitinase [Gandjariella thermophila]|uniref:Chitinase n=1 Tax=Gandjariella thermophila TaxID=1931992 RepID=A0A4D4J4L5_9PSEU|nr:chitinase [Gandjariella thermophila]GDY30050.1 chitinase [Gandjariella thermophila]
MRNVRRNLLAVLGAGALIVGAAGLAGAQGTPNATPRAAVNPVTASPYLYLGWGNPPDPASVMKATGIRAFTMAFVLSDGGCNPKWDGNRPITGGADQATIDKIRAAGGDVIVSFGGWSGNKLGEHCGNPNALAGAYLKVIDGLKLRAIDIDIENTEFTNPTVQDRVLGALRIVKQKNPAVRVVVTFGTTTTGPDGDGQRLIRRGAQLGAKVDVWSVMPFDFSGGGDMARYTETAVDGLHAQVKSAFGVSDDQAYRMIGLSSMNGRTDNAGETVTLANFRTILGYAQQHHLARFSFWSVNRDRPCGGGAGGDACSGTSQQPWDFTKVVARFTG